MCSKRATLFAFPELSFPRKEKMRQKCGQDCDECAKNPRGEIPKQAVLTWCFLYEEVEKKIDFQEFKTKKQPHVVKHKDTADTADTNNLHGCKKLPGKKVRKGQEVLADKGTGYPSPVVPYLQESQTQKAWGVFWRRIATRLPCFILQNWVQLNKP